MTLPAGSEGIDQNFLGRSSLLQAWGAYGVLWPVVHQQLGVDPDIGAGRLAVVPQLPPGQRRIAGSGIRIGNGSVDVTATGDGRSLRVEAADRLAHALVHPREQDTHRDADRDARSRDPSEVEREASRNPDEGHSQRCIPNGRHRGLFSWRAHLANRLERWRRRHIGRSRLAHGTPRVPTQRVTLCLCEPYGGF